MKRFALKSSFIMTSEEIEQYNALPDNMPDIKLSKKQIELVTALYSKYVYRTIESQSYEQGLAQVEMKEKWPSGPRVKAYEAKRFILNEIVSLNSPARKEMNSDEAAVYFLAAHNWRPFIGKIIAVAYDELKSSKAVLRKGETETEHVKAGQKYDYFYGYGGDFYLLIDCIIHEETSTAFDFVQ